MVKLFQPWLDGITVWPCNTYFLGFFVVRIFEFIQCLNYSHHTQTFIKFIQVNLILRTSQR